MANSRPTQLLILDPEDTLTFSGSDDTRCSTNLEVTNPTPYSICYKIKTTATRRYTVRPKVGLLMPYSRQIINFQVKGEKIDLLDKFKLLSAVLPSNAGADPGQMWLYINEATTMQSKFNVLFTENSHRKGHELIKKTALHTLIAGSLVVIIAFFASFFYKY